MLSGRKGGDWVEGWTVPCLPQDGTVPIPIIVFIIQKLLQHTFLVFPSCGDSVCVRCVTDYVINVAQTKDVNNRGREPLVTDGWQRWETDVVTDSQTFSISSSLDYLTFFWWSSATLWPKRTFVMAVGSVCEKDLWRSLWVKLCRRARRFF